MAGICFAGAIEQVVRVGEAEKGLRGLDKVVEVEVGDGHADGVKANVGRLGGAARSEGLVKFVGDGVGDTEGEGQGVVVKGFVFEGADGQKI